VVVPTEKFDFGQPVFERHHPDLPKWVSQGETTRNGRVRLLVDVAGLARALAHGLGLHMKQRISWRGTPEWVIKLPDQPNCALILGHTENDGRAVVRAAVYCRDGRHRYYNSIGMPYIRVRAYEPIPQMVRDIRRRLLPRIPEAAVEARRLHKGRESIRGFFTLDHLTESPNTRLVDDQSDGLRVLYFKPL
jgi:hypothetical protein